MTVEEIFAKLSAHMIKGLMIHDQFSKAYGFLNLCGYQKCHQYHYYEESYNYHCLRDYYLNNYSKMIPEEKIEDPAIIPVNWYKYTKKDVDINTKRGAIQTMMNKWADWEKETKALLESSYKELYDAGEVCAALKISYFLQDVAKELKYVQTKLIDLETEGYNMSSIIGEQKELYCKYEEKIHHIYDKD